MIFKDFAKQLSLQLEQQQQLNIQLQQQLQQQVQPLSATEPKKTKKVTKKPKIDEEKIEVCAIVYDCSSKHPNFHLNQCIDRYQIDEICGFGEDVFRDQIR